MYPKEVKHDKGKGVVVQQLDVQGYKEMFRVV